MKTLSKERIAEIIKDSADVYECLLSFYKEVLPVEWEKIENIKPWGIKISRENSLFMINEMHKKYTTEKGGDAWTVNSLMLNKGFSSSDSTVTGDAVKIEDDCYTLIK